MKSVILAGGLGTRLGNLTSAINKSLLPLDDSPLIAHLIRFAQSVSDSVLLTTTLGQVDAFARVAVGDPLINEKAIYYNIQEKPLGIADAVKYAYQFCNAGPLLVILGDNLHSTEDYTNIKTICKSVTYKDNKIGHRLRNLVRGTNSFGSHIWVTKRTDYNNYGVIELDLDGRPRNIIEKPTQSVSNLVITGIYLFDHHIWNILEGLTVSARGEYEITDVLNIYLSKNRLHVNHLTNEWFDIGQSIESYWNIIYKRHGRV